MVAARNPVNSRRAGADPLLSRLSMPKATLMIAEYSGPTTMAPTTRIWEFVKMPTAAISPAIARSENQLGG